MASQKSASASEIKRANRRLSRRTRRGNSRDLIPPTLHLIGKAITVIAAAKRLGSSRFKSAGVAVAVAVRQNRSTMKMTIFKGSEIEVEKEINNWLKAERINKIRHVTHVNYGATVYITVWWHPLDTGKNPSMASGLS